MIARNSTVLKFANIN